MVYSVSVYVEEEQFKMDGMDFVLIIWIMTFWSPHRESPRVSLRRRPPGSIPLWNQCFDSNCTEDVN